MSSSAKFLLPPNAGSTPQKIKWLSGWLVLVLAAVLIGDLVAHEMWLYLAAIAGLIIALRAPVEIALGMYVLVIPFETLAVFGQGTSAVTANRVLGILAAVAMLGTGILRNRLHRPPRAALWWTLLVLWAALSAFWALQPEMAVHALPTAFSLLGLYLIATSWQITERQYSLLIALVMLGACLASCFVIYQFAHGVSWKTWQGAASGRASLVLGGRETNPNRFGSDALLPFSLALGIFLSAESKRAKLLALITAGIIAYAAFLTMSRGSLLAIALIVGMFAFHKSLLRRLIPVALLLAMLVLAMPSSFFERLTASGPVTGSGRLDIWFAALYALRKYGGFGSGLNNFPVAYNEFAGQAAQFVGFNRAGHNMYLEVGVELGVIGLLLLCIGIFYHIRSLRQIRRVTVRHSTQLFALEVACWAKLVNSFFEGGLWDKSFWLIWMLCLMAVTLYKNEDQKRYTDGEDRIDALITDSVQPRGIGAF